MPVKRKTSDDSVIHESIDRYAVIVRDYHGGQRGYIACVHANAGQNEVFAKLSAKVDLAGAASVTVAEILLDTDEF